MDEQTKQIIKPQKSTAWIGGNIAAAVIFIALIVRFVGWVIVRFVDLVITGGFITANRLGEIALSIVFLFLGVFLGVKFAVGYVKRRSLIEEEKIRIISGIAAIIPLALVILFVFLDILIFKEGGEEVINFADLIINLISAFSVSVLIYFLVRHYLGRVKD